MKTIRLHGKHGEGKFAIVDDDDYLRVGKFRWRVANGYVVRAPNNQRLHWDIMRSKGIDHHDGNKLDNRKKNLRKASKSENGQNRGLQSNNRSGFKGVYWNSLERKWVGQIKCGGKKIHLGYFDSVVKAAIVYNIAAKKYHRKFAVLNVIRFCREPRFPRGQTNA